MPRKGPKRLGTRNLLIIKLATWKAHATSAEEQHNHANSKPKKETSNTKKTATTVTSTYEDYG